MASSALKLSGASRTMLPPQARHRSRPEHQRSFGFVLALLSLTLFTCFFTEKPNEVVSICEKYNTATACQIW